MQLTSTIIVCNTTCDMKKIQELKAQKIPKEILEQSRLGAFYKFPQRALNGREMELLYCVINHGDKYNKNNHS